MIAAMDDPRALLQSLRHALEATTPTQRAARDELQRGLTGLLGSVPAPKSSIVNPLRAQRP